MVLEGRLEELSDLSARARRREHLLRRFEHLSREHARDLRAPLDFASGEVFQALFRRPSAAPELLAALHDELHAEEHHLGLGWGVLCTPLSGRVRGMDGPAFDEARMASEAARVARAWACARGFGPAMDLVLDGHLLLLGQVQHSWKTKQRETIALMRRLGSRGEVARARGVNPSTVSRSLDGAHYEGVRALEQSLSLLLAAPHQDRPIPLPPRRSRP